MTDTTTTYRLNVSLDRDEIDADGMTVGAVETMLRLDVESSQLPEVAAVLSAATDVIAGRTDRRGDKFTVTIPPNASPAEIAEILARGGSDR